MQVKYFIIALMVLFSSVVNADEISYYSFPDPFISNINSSSKIVQISLTLISEYKPEIYDNINKHNLAVRDAINQILYQTNEEGYKVSGRFKLTENICQAINKVLIAKVRFGGIKEVQITDIVIR